MTSEDDHRVTEGTCWLACFDLLGFTRRVYDFAQHRYASGIDGLSILAGVYLERVLKALDEEVACQRQYGRTLHYAHFSDTFILYAPGDSRECFETINSAAGNFFTDMVRDVGPLRGALTCGRFYADRARNIFVGPALIDAHDYAEKQDWIGYVLTPQAVEELSKMKPPVVWPGDYVWWKVPVKVERTVNSRGEKMVMIGREQLLAFQMGSYPEIRESVRGMKKGTRTESRDNYKRCRSKYLGTLLFMRDTKSMRSSRLTME